MKNEIRCGECKRCGNCCRAKNLWESLKWSEKIVAFIIITSKGIGLKKYLKGHCSFLRSAGDRAKCVNYKDRPSFCRKYPAVEGDRIKYCGFYFKEETNEGKN